ncbi:GLPGLI family protein [Paucihalobacter sp.]|uniref:GLPGLI family protein n=1 Tax=Paucihalobacter sp. TaxID=2850405 RepID=UPI002FE0D1D7
MKNILINLSVLIAMLVISNVSAQDFQGIATYKTHRKVSIKMDSTKVTSAMEKEMQEMLKKQFQKTYKLAFSKDMSVYKEEETLGAPQAGSGMMVSSFDGGGSDALFKDTKSLVFTNQKETMGKIFLIQDSLPNYNWKLENETKNIGEYTCFKATYTREIEVPKNNNLSFSVVESDDEPEMTTKEIVTTAWYTPQIPVSNGPGKYQGLPGLILEINDGSQTIICTSIVLNPTDKLEIKAPTKGKRVSQTEYKVLVDKRLQEMQEQNRPAGRSGGGEHIEIRIGG